MFDVKRTLRDGAKQLQKLHKDLYPPTFSRLDWKFNVHARQSLGDNVEVELWYLAEHFLLAWYDWHTLHDRFPRYFGESASQFPASWQRLDAQCMTLANQLLLDKNLDELIGKYWMTTGVVGDERQEETPSLRDVYHTVVQNHRRWTIMKFAEEGRLEPRREVYEMLPSPKEVWPECRKLVRRLNELTLETCRRLDDILGRELRFHLRHYLHANLLVSWLTDDEKNPPSSSGNGRGDGSSFNYGDRHGDGQGYGGHLMSGIGLDRSALIQLLWEKPMISSIEHYVHQFQNPDLSVGVKKVLERITQAIGEIGYEDFVADVVSSDFHGGEQSLVGTNSINIIPGPARGQCHSLLLAVSKGDKKAIGFPNIMRQVREQLIRCKETKAVIVLCDHWHPGMLEEHLGDLRAHHENQGIRFLFLMVGLPGRVMSPVAVDLGMTP